MKCKGVGGCDSVTFSANGKDLRRLWCSYAINVIGMALVLATFLAVLFATKDPFFFCFVFAAGNLMRAWKEVRVSMARKISICSSGIIMARINSRDRYIPGDRILDINLYDRGKNKPDAPRYVVAIKNNDDGEEKEEFFSIALSEVDYIELTRQILIRYTFAHPRSVTGAGFFSGGGFGH